MVYYRHFRYIPINTITYNVALGMSPNPVYFLTNNLFYYHELHEFLMPSEAVRTMSRAIGVTNAILKANARYPLAGLIHSPDFYNPIEQRVMGQGKGKPRITTLSTYLSIPKLDFYGNVEFTTVPKGRNLMVRTDFIPGNRSSCPKFSEYMYIKPQPSWLIKDEQKVAGSRHHAFQYLGKIEYAFEVNGQTTLTTSLDMEMNKSVMPSSLINIERQLDMIARKFLK
jgi:hypothetical protein